MTMSAGASETASQTKSTPSGGGGGASSTTTEFEPPLACVRRLLKNSLPSCNVGKDASSAFARACGIFVIYLTACANDFARESKRQTITANDILAAVTELEFDEFTPQLKAFLEQHRAEEKKKKREKDAKKAAEAQADAEAAGGKRPIEVGDDHHHDGEGADGDGESNGDGSPRKRQKPNPADPKEGDGDSQEDAVAATVDDEAEEGPLEDVAKKEGDEDERSEGTGTRADAVEE